MNSPSSKFDASLMFRVIKLLLCPFFFCGISLGATLTQDDFTWGNGSYAPVFGAWLIAYGFWALYTRYESAVAGYILHEKSNAKEVGDKLDTLLSQHPFSWQGRIELLVFGVAFVIAACLPEFGFQILWLTVGHFLFVVVWRTITQRLQSPPIAT